MTKIPLPSNTHSGTNSEQLQSKVISFLRFPLCVAVVLIHVSVNLKDCQAYPIHYYLVHCFCKGIITRVAVPLFFMFSGFLFFYKLDKFTISTYRNKLVKRVRTLLIPYIFWNLALILYCLSLRFLGFNSQFGIGFDFVDYLSFFWNSRVAPINGEGIASYPISIQFWYIRDLMVTVLLSPIIYWLTKKLHIYFVIALATLWITNYWPLITGINIAALFFFSLGAYFSIYKKNFVEFLKPHTLLLGFAYLLTIVPILIAQEPNFNPLRRLGILFGMGFIISLAARYISTGKWRMNKFLSESSFFIFAYHILAIRIIEAIVSFSFQKDIMCAALYIAKSGFIVVAGLGIYYLLKRFMPRFTSFITGGR